MGASYDATLVGAEALHYIRFVVGATQVADKALVDDEEITGMLTLRGLTATSSPVTYEAAVKLAAADVCDAIAANFSRESQIPFTEVGPIKAAAAEQYRMLAKRLRFDVRETGGKPIFADPASYPVGHIADVDDLPTLETG
jgi:hypothetical protein